MLLYVSVMVTRLLRIKQWVIYYERKVLFMMMEAWLLCALCLIVLVLCDLMTLERMKELLRITHCLIVTMTMI